MRVLVRGFSMQLLSKMIALIAALSLAPPVMPSVLCVAPGSHVAIEELDAGCCASSSTSTRGHGQTEDMLGTADDCEDCTDYLISALAEGRIPESAMAAGYSITAECGSLQPPAIPVPPPSSEIVPPNLGASNLLHFSIPLRC